jgi:hypothetical protein
MAKARSDGFSAGDMIMAMRFWLLAAPVVLLLTGSACAADDVMLLGGKANDAKTMTLKGSAETSAADIEVFHGRLLACLCHNHWGYCAPAYSYSYGCLGCNGCLGCYGCIGYGGPAYSAGYAAPSYYGSVAPTVAPVYSPTAPAMGVYGPPRPAVPAPATSVTVTTPRASFSLSLGNGIIIGRSALTSGRLAGVTDQPIDAPPSQRMPNPPYRGETLPTPRARPGETFR